MIGYKKVYYSCSNQYGSYNVDIVLKLDIQGSVVRRAGYDKLRTDKAKVLAAFYIKRGNWKKETLNKAGKRFSRKQEEKLIFHSLHDESFTYKVGNVVTPRWPFNSNIHEDCGSGIHFYLTSEKAANH